MPLWEFTPLRQKSLSPCVDRGSVTSMSRSKKVGIKPINLSGGGLGDAVVLQRGGWGETPQIRFCQMIMLSTTINELPPEAEKTGINNKAASRR